MRKRGKRIKYTKDRTSWFHTIGMQQSLTDSQMDTLGVAVRISLENMRIGKGSDRDWYTLGAACNVSMIMCERGVGASYMDDVQEAKEALVSIRGRHAKFRSWAFSGQEYKSLIMLADIHEAQLAAVTRDSIKAVMLEAIRRVDRGEVIKFEDASDEATPVLNLSEDLQANA